MGTELLSRRVEGGRGQQSGWVVNFTTQFFPVPRLRTTGTIVILSLHAYLLTYLLHGAESFLRSQIVNFAASQDIFRIYGTRKFLTVPTSARHLSLSWANSIQSPWPPPTSWPCMPTWWGKEMFNCFLYLYVYIHLQTVHISTEGYRTNFTYVLLQCNRRSINNTRTCHNITLHSAFGKSLCTVFHQTFICGEQQNMQSIVIAHARLKN